jgi:hypothetical protein
MEHRADRANRCRWVVQDSSSKNIGIWKQALANHVFAWLHRNPGQRQLNPFWPVRTHLKRHMSQSDAR